MTTMSEKGPTASEIWRTLSAVNVNEHTEEKAGLTYLSWAWAWAVMMDHFPQLTVKWHGWADAAGVTRDIATYPGGTASVSCSVTIGDVTREMWLPVMDHRNKAITNPDSFSVNTAKMRCLTKCFGIFGLGGYIYAGEDLPTQGERPTKPTKPTTPTEKAGKAWNEAEFLAERLDVLSAILIACEEHGGVDTKTIALGREIVASGGPLDRLEKAISHLQREILGHA